MNALNTEDVRNTIADMLHDTMGIDRQRVLQDTLFSELHKDFDSLAFAELQFALEDRFKMEFDDDDKSASVPANVTELAQILVRHYAVYQNKMRAAQQAKDDAASKPAGS